MSQPLGVLPAQFDIPALERYLQLEVPGLSGSVQVEQLKGGQSNPTFLLTSERGRYVLRKKPGGTLLPSAHAVEREFKVISALQQTGVPVPRTLCLCEDPTVIGTSFYVMEYVEGRIFWDPALPDLTRTERTALYDDINRVVAALHCVDPSAVGLHDFGGHGGYMKRQIGRWGKQYTSSSGGHPIEALDRLMEWLPARIPVDESVSVVHGDLRIDNLIVHPTEPRVVAVLDWEISTLGDPLADLSYHMITWDLRPDEFRGMAGLDLSRLGIPQADEYLARYCERVGRTLVPSDVWDFYAVYNLFRLAAMLHGIGRRAESGTAADSAAYALGTKARQIADIGWRWARERLAAS